MRLEQAPHTNSFSYNKNAYTPIKGLSLVDLSTHPAIEWATNNTAENLHNNGK